MRYGNGKEFLLPPGPIMSLTLIGIMFLSGLLYYRAIKVQRFLEPALAISQPRSEFTDAVNLFLKNEFEPAGLKGVRMIMGTIVVDPAVFLDEGRGRTNGAASPMVKRLGRVLVAALNNDYLRSHVDLVLVVARYPMEPDEGANRQMKLRMRERSEMVLDSLFRVEPLLGERYASYFAATAMAADPAKGGADRIEFRIIPSERLHIEVLQRLKKYVD
jgi:hypothetical protein